MSFLQLVRREMEGSLGRLVFVSAMGGLSTTAIIGAIFVQTVLLSVATTTAPGDQVSLLNLVGTPAVVRDVS